MNEFRPPAPIPPVKQPSILRMVWESRRCSISNLVERSYSMKMGHVHLPLLDLYMINQPDLVRRVLVDEAEKFPKHDYLSRMTKNLLGDGIFVTNGEQWKRQRRMVDPAFAQARLQVVFPLMLEAVSAMQERFDALEHGTILSTDVETTHVTADIIFRTIFSMPLQQEAARAVFHAFSRFQDVAPTFGIMQMARIPSFLTFNYFRVAWAARKIRSLFEPLVKERYDRHQRGEELTEQDILTSLVLAKDPETGAVFDLKELVDQVAVLFLAGHETSASALAWALYLIAMRPDVQERLHDEAVKVLGEREPQFADIKQLKFARDVFRETLRLYPPVGFITREATQTEQMRDKTICPGSLLIISPWLIHRHRKLWDRADEFDPDRYQTDSAKESLRCAYLPFSLGARVCSGAAFAMQEATLIIASLARRYRFEPKAGHIPKPIGRLTIRSANGIKLKLWQRISN